VRAKVEIDWIRRRHEACSPKSIAWSRRHRRTRGFGIRGIEGKIAAAGYAREENVPYLVSARPALRGHRVRARQVRLGRANSSEFDPHSPHPVIDLMDDQKAIVDMAAPCVGAYPARLEAGSIVRRPTAKRSSTSVTATATSSTTATGRCSRITHGLLGELPDGCSSSRRVARRDASFLRRHPGAPEFKSRPNRPHPLFAAFVEAARQAPKAAPALRSRPMRSGAGRPGAEWRRCRADDVTAFT